ncbi:helix-turn-helix transcriptional regulator [Escherichia coli]|nr:helix-turn-helix transcriptional regulator [Escherichia coli]
MIDNKESKTSDTISVKNIYTLKHTIIFADNCEITFKKNNECIYVQKGNFVFIERGIHYSCEITKFNLEVSPFKVIPIDNDLLTILKDMLINIYSHKLNEKCLTRNLKDKVINVRNENDISVLFKKIQKSNNTKVKAIKIAHLISITEECENIIRSLFVSSAFTFTDKVKTTICADISKKWRLSMLADKFNVSEVTIRKRLETEGTSFNNLLLDIRMSQAMKMLLENEKKINQISNSIGISSVSYFIRTFKEYYGLTPKQLIIFFCS